MTNSPIDNAAKRAMVIESSIVMRRSRRFLNASLKTGYPPTSVAMTPIRSRRRNGAGTRNPTASAAIATRAIRTRSEAWDPAAAGF